MVKQKLFFLTLVTLLCFSHMSSQEQKTINVMSFNIRYDNPDDGIQNWHNRKANVVNMIKFYDLDIIGLQEVLKNQLLFLKENLNDYGVIGVGRDDGIDKGEFSPIMYRKSKFKQLDSGTFWLSETPDKVSVGWDASMERIATWALFEDKTSGRKLVFMNTHFDHRGEKAQINSAKLIKQKSYELAEQHPFILTGDFNLKPNSKGIKNITKQNKDLTIRNAKSIAKITYGPDWTFSGFDNRPFESREEIDYIFVRNIRTIERFAVLSEKLNTLF
jgi:endonuclease/exonuclease/phosphatase family metal-dependent hydrolase